MTTATNARALGDGASLVPACAGSSKAALFNPMKILPEHVAHMREKIAPLTPKLMPHFNAVTNNNAAKNPAMRTRWDALYAAGLSKWICDTLYSYANDDHIDTALRSIMRELNLPQLSA